MGEKILKKEYLLAIYTIFCWGTLPAVTKLALTSISNMQVLFISSLVATICLLIYLFVSRKIKLFKVIGISDLLQLIGLGFIGNFLYSAFYYASIRTLPSTDACVINYLWPIIATICASFILHEKIGVKSWFAILMSFAGVITISTKGSGLRLTEVKGILLCIAGSVCYGVFNVLNKKKGMDQYLCTTVYFAVTTICSGIVFFKTEHFYFMSTRTWGGIIWLGVFIDALAILAWGLALQKTEVGFLSNLAYTTPVTAMLISIICLGEPIQLYTICGMLLVLGGCFLQMFVKRNHSTM